MKKIFLILSVLLGQDCFSNQLKTRFESIIKSHRLKESQIGIYVLDKDSQSELLNIHGLQKRKAASLSKLVTTMSFLKKYPPEAKVMTQLFAAGKVTDGALDGSLYLKGGGDPAFVSESMWNLVNNFSRSEIKKIKGDIYIDDKLFDDTPFDESRQSKRVDRAYDAPVSAMSFNWNSVNIYVRPGTKGSPAKIFMDPENEYTEISGKVNTVDGSSQNIQVSKRVLDNKEVFSFSGSIGVNAAEAVIYKNINRPYLWVGYQLKSFLAQRGIGFIGKISRAKTPDSANLIAEVSSKSPAAMLIDMNKFSNNFVAEMLAKLIATQDGKVGTIAGSMKIMNQYLQDLDPSHKEFQFINPSGLTHDNELSPRLVVKIISELTSTNEYSPEFLSSLPIAGIDGTLKKRMKNSEVKGAVRAKTGLLNGVVGLAGVAKPDHGHEKIFAFIANTDQDEAMVRQCFDEFAQALVTLNE